MKQCKICIHRKVCRFDMENFCLNYKFGGNGSGIDKGCFQCLNKHKCLRAGGDKLMLNCRFYAPDTIDETNVKQLDSLVNTEKTSKSSYPLFMLIESIFPGDPEAEKEADEFFSTINVETELLFDEDNKK